MTAPPRRSGYTPCTWQMLDAAISGEAALLLLRLRRLADENESNGWIEGRDIASVAAFHRMHGRRVNRCLDELVKLGLFYKDGDLYHDLQFSDVCRTREQREQLREEWREHKRKARKQPEANSNPPMSNPDSTLDSTPESTASPSSSPSSSTSPSPTPTSNGWKPKRPLIPRSPDEPPDDYNERWERALAAGATQPPLTVP